MSEGHEIDPERVSQNEQSRRDTDQIGRCDTLTRRKKTKRRRCDNPQCGRLYWFDQTNSSTCSHRCRTALYRQRKTALVALVRVLAAAAAKSASQEQMRKASSHMQANMEQLEANRRAAAFEAERERYQQAAREEAEAERRRPPAAPAADNREVTLYDNPSSFAGRMTNIPSNMKPGLAMTVPEGSFGVTMIQRPTHAEYIYILELLINNDHPPCSMGWPP